jgi:flagellar biosynthesis protein FliR
MYLPFSPLQLETYLMIFIRTGAIIFSVPLFGSKDFPTIAKVGMTLCIAWIIYPSVNLPSEPSTIKVLQLLPSIGAEILIGIVIGFTARMFFEGIQLGGQLIGFQMGFGIVNVFDPISGANFSIIAQFQNLLAILLFLSMNMHHWFFKAIAMSFNKIPLFYTNMPYTLLEWVIGLSSNIFLIAVKVGAPIIATLLFTSAGLGLIAKAVPQVNVLMVGFPMKIAAGLFAIGISMNMFALVVKKTFSHYGEYVFTILKLSNYP